MRFNAPSALLLACAYSTCTSAALPPATRNASAECPCIDPWASNTTNVTRRVSATGVSVPANYGSSRCVRWDAGLGSACTAPVPAD